MSKAIIEALAMRVEALEKTDKTTSMRVEALEKTLAAQLNVSDKVKKEADKEVKKEKAAAKKEKKEKKAKADPSEDKPKRVNGYILFCNSNRDDVKTKLSVDGEKPKNTEVMTELARLWKVIDVEEKEEWKTKAKSNLALPHTHHNDDDNDDDNDNDDDDD